MSLTVQRIAAALAAAYPATELDTLEVRDYGRAINVVIGLEYLGVQYRAARLIDKREATISRLSDAVIDAIAAEMFCDLFKAAAGPPPVLPG